ncbi:class I SAM-dependent methyltransferase [Virgibacillus xinjiangensis]|uniref:Class I SAM-dependent methyltransferase n=1 Tax=Virgibacillus xinjiangensis TaxID=393090 RepID=A0ABV7CSK5_9BACI
MSKEQWDDSFSDEEYVYGTSPNKFIEKMSGLLSDRSNIGCFAEGEGRNAVYLAKLGHTVTAYDQSPVGLAKAEDLAKEHGVNLHTAAVDLTKEKVEAQQFDAAVMVFGHVPKESQSFLIENILDSVKAGGYILLEVYSEDQLHYRTGGPKSLDMLYHPSQVLEWIEDHQCLHFYYGEAERNEGKRHHGTGHVIQAAVRKKEADEG